jgi:hypothetical protein
MKPKINNRSIDYDGYNSADKGQARGKIIFAVRLSPLPIWQIAAASSPIPDPIESLVPRLSMLS